MRATQVALLQGPSLRFGLCCPDPSSLNRPHPPCSRAHRNFTARRLMRPTGCPSSPMPSTMPTPGTSTSRPPPMRSRSSSPPSGNERAGCLRPGAAPRAPVEQVSMRSSPRPGDLPPHGRCAEPRPAGTPAPWMGPRARQGGRQGHSLDTGALCWPTPQNAFLLRSSSP